MNRSAALASIRKRHFALDDLPDTIVIPASAILQRKELVVPIEEATLDDIAFAMGGIEEEFNVVGDRLHALRKLYNLAREAGAPGTARAVDIILRHTGSC